MNNDIFTGAAVFGTGLDVVTVMSAAIATAVTPASTKTWWAALATMSSGSRLAASKNILHEKDSVAIIRLMTQERQLAIDKLRVGMTKSIEEYPVDVGVMDLTAYFYAGSLNRNLPEAMVKDQEAFDSSIQLLRDTIASATSKKYPGAAKDVIEGDLLKVVAAKSIDKVTLVNRIPESPVEAELTRVVLKVERPSGSAALQEADRAAIEALLERAYPGTVFVVL
jgi:hypothetical protein